MLQQHVVANGVDKGPQPVRIAQRTVSAQDGKHARKGLLAHIVDGLAGWKARTKLQVKKLGEISDEMLLGAAVPCTKTLDITGIERFELQRPLRKPLGGRKYSIVNRLHSCPDSCPDSCRTEVPERLAHTTIQLKLKRAESLAHYSSVSAVKRASPPGANASALGAAAAPFQELCI